MNYYLLNIIGIVFITSREQCVLQNIFKLCLKHSNEKSDPVQVVFHPFRAIKKVAMSSRFQEIMN
jgi:hypothetical protein